MRLFKDEEPYLTKEQLIKVFTVTSLLTVSLYIIAMIFSLSGSNYFIINYQNAQIDAIENWFKERQIMPLFSWLFTTLEFFIVATFVLKGKCRIWYVLSFYIIAMIVSATIPSTPIIFYTIYPFSFHIIIPLIEQLVSTKKISMKTYGFQMLRLVIAVLYVLGLEAIITVIKGGYFDGQNHIMSLSAHFIYAIECDIALSVLLFTTSLYIDREKGDNKLWVTFHTHGSSSQNSTKPSLKSNMKNNLTKTQRSKIRRLMLRLYLLQLGAFVLVMVLPFLLGKVFEFLVMYLSFALTRYVLGFKYSLHYRKETTCIMVGVIVFGILSLVVPFFYVVLIMAILLGAGLAILLHLSYKYKGMWLFNKVSKPDKFAEIYVIFDGKISEYNIKKMCFHYGIPKEDTQILWQYANGEKMFVIAHQFHYSIKTIETLKQRI